MIYGANGEPITMTKARAARQIRARFDAAQTDRHNARHWANADALSADAAADPATRQRLRDRARYEVANNTYAKGLVQTVARDAVGTGPRLQCLTADNNLNKRIEEDFALWCHAIGYARKLLTMRMARTQDGETFGIMGTNPKISHPVQLDLIALEADRVTDRLLQLPTETEIDGITLDRWGNRIEYRILDRHPGSRLASGMIDEATVYPASAIIHHFRADRPGQNRGIPEITPALPLFAQLRRFTLATLSAAEYAAAMSAVLESDLPAGEESFDDIEALEELEFGRNMITTMPFGWKMNQMRAEHPTTTYREFKREILGEIARCLDVPFNVAAGDSSEYNYASGRLDKQTYYVAVKIDRAHIDHEINDRIFAAWLWEYAHIVGVPSGIDLTQRLPHKWMYDGTEHVDPLKEANAQAVRLANNTTSLADECAREGKDWEEHLAQIAREQARMRELGITRTVPSGAEQIIDEEDYDDAS